MPKYSTENIPYQEFHAINELMRLHPAALDGKLRALIAFGDLVASGQSLDIDLLEVIEDWSGPRHVSFRTTASLPLRGQLRVYFLTPSEFENPSEQHLAEEEWSSADLLRQVRLAYTIILETPPNYAHDVMATIENTPTGRPLRRTSDDPGSFFLHQGEKIA